MTRLQAASSVQDLIAATLDFCVSCQQPLSKADDNYITCLSCEGAICRNCSSCPCDLYGVPVSDSGEVELLAFVHTLETMGLLQKS
jgi:hypothetical protein